MTAAALTRHVWIEGMRVFAAFCVVLLHAAAPHVVRFGTPDWAIANMYDGLVQSCVPLFLMISGYLLLDRDESLRDVLVKRVVRIMIPLAFWTLVFLTWRFAYRENFNPSFYAFYSLVLSPAYYHLWFLYALAGLYLMLPLLRLLFRNAKREHLALYVALWVIASSLIPLFEKMTGIHSKVDLGAVTGLAGYLFLGAVLGRMPLDARKVALGILALTVGAAITVMGTAWLSERSGAFDRTFYGSLSPSVILMSAGTFLLLRHFLLQRGAPGAVTRSLAAASFGIYLVHPLFLDLITPVIENMLMRKEVAGLALAIPLTAVSAFLLSWLAVRLLMALPVLRRTVT